MTIKIIAFFAILFLLIADVYFVHFLADEREFGETAFFFTNATICAIAAYQIFEWIAQI